MGATGWATQEQRELLKSMRPEYEKCRVGKKYKGFWRKLFAIWLEKYPLVEEMFPGRKVEDLDGEESETYSKSLLKLQEVRHAQDKYSKILTATIASTEAEGVVSLAVQPTDQERDHSSHEQGLAADICSSHAWSQGI